MKIRKLNELVKEELEFNPITRTNDNILIFNLYFYHFQVDTMKTSFEDVLNNKELPKIASILRARRKVQELYPDLKVEKVAEARINKESEFIEMSQDKSI